MRTLTRHQTNNINKQLTITVKNESCGRYDISGFDTRDNPNGEAADGYRASFSMSPIVFHQGEGPPKGVTVEALIAIAIDKLESFQNSKYATREGALTITKLQEALFWMEERTRSREARGVEGTKAV